MLYILLLYLYISIVRYLNDINIKNIIKVFDSGLWDGLEVISLVDNSISDSGLSYLCKALSKRKYDSLKHINFSCIYIII